MDKKFDKSKLVELFGGVSEMKVELLIYFHNRLSVMNIYRNFIFIFVIVYML